jgi:hypothetical protein
MIQSIFNDISTFGSKNSVENIQKVNFSRKNYFLFKLKDKT